MQWQQLIVVFIAFGAPALTWAFNKLREQYEKKRQADIKRLREEESIRVQRTAERLDQSSPQTQAQRRIEELGARRQAQLEELRRRRAAAGERPATPDHRPAVVLAPTTTPTRTPPQGPMRPGVPGAPMRMPNPAVPPAPGTPRPGVPRQPGGQQGPRPARPQVPPTAPARQRPQQGRLAQAPVAATVASVQQAARATSAKSPAPATQGVTKLTGPQQRAFNAAKAPGALARAMLVGRGARDGVTVATAFALTEILSKPVTLRDNPFGDHR